MTKKVSAALRSRVADLATHCWPTDAAAVQELRVPEAPLVTSFVCPPILGSTKFSDITGLKYGRMVVVGLFMWCAAGQSLWVLRCSCGRHETRLYKRVVRGVRLGHDAYCHICNIKLGKWDGAEDRPVNGLELASSSRLENTTG